jgi:type II secretory pathway pseudopilin PulG
LTTTLHRGSALLTVLVVLVALTLMAAALLRVSGRQSSGSRQFETSARLSNCAQAVRSYLGSQVAGGAGTDSLSFTVAGTTAPIKLEGGHYETINVTGFKLTPSPPFGVVASASVENLANALPLGVGRTSTPVRGSAVCTDASGRTYEVEFSFVSG